MPTIITPTEQGLVLQNPDHGAKVGRWCKPPQVPDRCYTCFDPDTLAHYPAEGYIEEHPGWRYGCCHRCWPQGAIAIECTTFYCSHCPAELATAEQAQTHLVEAHADFAAWLSERLGATPLPIGAPIWYYMQAQEPAHTGWQPARITSWGGKDGRPVADIMTTAGYFRWGWIWQILPRAPGEAPPAQPPAELTGGR